LSVAIAIGFAKAASAQTPPAPAPAQQARVTIGFVEIEGDPRTSRSAARAAHPQTRHPFAGAQLGIDEAQALARVLKTDSR